MARYNTGNPIDSNAMKDLSDNAQNLDVLVNSKTALTQTDRLGVERKTWYGMEKYVEQSIAFAGYVFSGDYALGVTLTSYNQIVRDGSGEFWRASGSTDLPYTLTGAGVDEGGALVSVGDAQLRSDLSALRSDLSAPSGAGIVGFGSTTVKEAIENIASDVSSISALTSTYEQSTGIQETNAQSALDALGRANKDGLFITPSSMGHAAGQLAFKVRGSNAELISNLNNYKPRGAFATPENYADLDLIAYFVKPDGATGADGLGWDTALNSVSEAASKADADVVFVKAGVYASSSSEVDGIGQNIGIYSRNKDISIQSVGGDVIFISAPTQSQAAWATTSNPVIFKRNVTSIDGITGISSKSVKDSFGIPYSFKKKDSSGETATDLGSYALAAGQVFVSMPDGGAPVGGDLMYTEQGAMRVINISSKFHQSGIHYIGGSGGSFSALDCAGGVIFSENCTFSGNSLGDAFRARDVSLVISKGCMTSRAANDGFNYHRSFSTKTSFIEIDCIAVGAQKLGTGNGSTAHEDCVGIRVNCDYSLNKGPGVADVNDAKTYNVCVTSNRNIESSSAHGFESKANDATGSGSEVWLHSCSSGDNNGTDVAASDGGIVRVFDTHYITLSESGGGVIEVFEPFRS